MYHKNKEYRTKIYKNPVLLMILYIIVAVFIIGITIYYSRIYHWSSIIGISVGYLVGFSPIIFNKKIKSYFINNVLIKFENTQLIIIQYDRQFLDKEQKREVYLWSDIKAYKFYFSQKLAIVISLYLKDGKRKKFIFLDSKSFEDSINTDSFFGNFYYSVAEFNQNSIKNKIVPAKTFFSTEIGRNVITIEVCMIVFAFALHILTHNFSNSYYLILAIGFIIPQIFNRVQNKAMFKKMAEMG